MHLHFRSFGLEWEVVSRIWHETYGFHGPVYDVCVRRVKVSGTKRPYGHFEPADLATAAEFEAEEVDSVESDSDPKVVPSLRPGRGSGLSYPVSSAPAPKKARGREPDVVLVYDSDTSSKAASVATTLSAQSGRAHGPSASAEDHCLGLDARRTVPGQFVHRAVAAAAPAKRHEVHPPHPFIAKRQVRRSECPI